MKKSTEIIGFLLFLCFMTSALSTVLYQQAAAGMMTEELPESDTFRQMKFTETSLSQLIAAEQETAMPASEILTILQTENMHGFLKFPKYNKKTYLLRRKSILQKYNQKGYERIRRAYRAVWDDLKCFPTDPEGIAYENSWMFERTYGGKRGHEGTDLMPPENVSGYYTIYSMTDGTVENIGWLAQGGYRIGIRSPSGGYFYYAHLDSYSRPYTVGDPVEAGEPLGLMGDTGYGEEGTRGKFAVHLHLGIYIQTPKTSEISINPYWILQYIFNSKT